MGKTPANRAGGGPITQPKRRHAPPLVNVCTDGLRFPSVLLPTVRKTCAIPGPSPARTRLPIMQIGCCANACALQSDEPGGVFEPQEAAMNGESSSDKATLAVLGHGIAPSGWLGERAKGNGLDTDSRFSAGFPPASAFCQGEDNSHRCGPARSPHGPLSHATPRRA